MPERPIPRHVPTLVATRVTTATTYHFKNAAKDFGWALATVNDETGELTIQSDWGKWSYRWDARPSNLGAPTLTHFIADRSGCDYLADKLWGRGYGGHRFSPDKTVARFRRELAEKRLEEGRHHLMLSEYGYADTYIDRMDAGACSPRARKRKYYDHQCWSGADGEALTKGIAREIWDALSDLEDVRDEGVFIERLYGVNGHTWIGDELWDALESETDPMYEVLLLGILPALREACKKSLEPAPASWWRRLWRRIAPEQQPAVQP